jgi:hypothetical protein
MNEASALADFELPATGNQRHCFSAFRGEPLLIHLDPHDGTRGAMSRDRL